MDTIVNTSGLEEVDILCALYADAKPQGLGFLHFVKGPLDREEARGMLAKGYRHFDYLKGRVMKVCISTEQIDMRLYDRDNGQGAGAAAIEKLRQRLNKAA